MNKKKLIIFFHPNIWEQSSLEALEVEKFRKFSNVVAYELGYLINKNLVSAFQNRINKKYIKKFASFYKWKKHFLNLINQYDLKDILIINKIRPTNLWSLLILIELSKLKINIIEYQNSGMPKFYINKTFKEKIKIASNIFYILNSLKVRLFNFLAKSIKFNNYFYLISGSPDVKLKSKKVIHGSSWDMAKTFMKNKNLNMRSKFAVYIQSTMAHAADQIIIGPNMPIIDKQRWFKNLNKFFDYFEKKYNLKVIIAVHPKVNRSQAAKLFRKRKVFKNMTKELIHKSNFVFFERSSAINFIVKYKKPAVMLYNKDTISNSYHKKTHMGFSKLLGIKNIDIEKYVEKDFKNLFFINKIKYHKYYKAFINFKNLQVPNSLIIKKKFFSNNI